MRGMGASWCMKLQVHWQIPRAECLMVSLAIGKSGSRYGTILLIE